jgi:hypothetical protein
MIGEALTSGTLQRDESAGAVIDAKRDAVRIAEIELRQIAMQMVFAEVRRQIALAVSIAEKKAREETQAEVLEALAAIVN